MAAVPPSVANRLKAPRGGRLSHIFLIQVVAYQHFGELQDAVGHRILVAYDAFRPFVYEAVGVDGMLHQHVVVGLFQQFGSGW